MFFRGKFIFDIIKERNMNFPFLIGGFIGITLMVLGLVMKKNSKQVNPLFK